MEQVPINPIHPVKKPFIFSKHVVGISVLVLVICGMIGGIFAMGNMSKRKFQSIVMKVPHQSGVSQAPTQPPTPIPTIDPTSSWQTYVNNSFSIKYPKRFTIKETLPVYTSLYPKKYTQVAFTDGINTFTITVAKNTANYTLGTVIGNGPLLRYDSTSLISSEKQDSVIDGKAAVRYNRIPTAGQGTGFDTLLIYNGKIYEFTLSPMDADTPTFDAMLTTVTLLNNEPSDITDSWQVYTDNYYGFTFKYPLTYGIDHAKATKIPSLTMVFDANKTLDNAPQFKIEVQDINNLGLSDFTSRNIIKLPLDQFVDKKWELNNASDSAVPNRTASAIQALSISGKTAYQMTVTGEYRDDIGSELLNQAYIYVFTESNGYKYKIWYPKADQTFAEIFKTLTFTK